MIAPADYVKKLVQENLPPVPARLALPQVSAKNAAAIAQIQAWMEEEATNDPEEIRQSETDLRELMHNLNQNRIESGERPLFPNASHPA